MRKFKHLIFDERNLFKDLLLSDTCKNKKDKINLSEIARQMVRGINIVKRKNERFEKTENYIPFQTQKDYKQRCKKCIKKYLNWQNSI